MKLLSIVTPTLNSGQTIERLFVSLLKITCIIEEWIIVDSFSDDDIFEMSQEFNKHIRVRFIQVPPNGPYNAMNHGIRKAVAEYVWIINSDDYIYTFSINSFIRALDKKPDIIYGKVLRNYANQTLSIGGSRFASPLFLRLNEIHPSVIVSRNVYQVVGLFDEHYKIAADLDFFLRILSVKGSISAFYLKDLQVSFSVGGISTYQDESIKSYLRMLINNRASLLFSVWLISRRLWAMARKNLCLS